ncbi:hypothetical protein GGR56DRAFT_632412 [Xylariaceae sp. FL0804]|nr:hypothetical protein GGR56DRAFT_632412 [Xylariaceae sp. FL0804]
MADDEQVSLTSLILIVVLGGLIVRYLFFPSSSSQQTPAQQSREQQQQRSRGDAQAAQRAREGAVDRIQQMFPQIDRRTVLWNLQRNGGSISTTTDRILAGYVESPPITFQPPPPPPTSPSPLSASQPSKVPSRPAEPDLITRYRLQDKVGHQGDDQPESTTSKGKKAWSSNRDERQASLQRRRDEMILAARRKMEARMAAEGPGGTTS